jgi:hypothetical protein
MLALERNQLFVAPPGLLPGPVHHVETCWLNLIGTACETPRPEAQQVSEAAEPSTPPPSRC